MRRGQSVTSIAKKDKTTPDRGRTGASLCSSLDRWLSTLGRAEPDDTVIKGIGSLSGGHKNNNFYVHSERHFGKCVSNTLVTRGYGGRGGWGPEGKEPVSGPCLFHWGAVRTTRSVDGSGETDRK